VLAGIGVVMIIAEILWVTIAGVEDIDKKKKEVRSRASDNDDGLLIRKNTVLLLVL
jgi:hypothetical protein